MDCHHLGRPWSKRRGVHIRTVVDLTTEFVQITWGGEQAALTKLTSRMPASQARRALYRLINEPGVTTEYIDLVRWVG